MSSAPSRLEREQGQVRWNLGLLVASTLTGYATWVFGITLAGLQVAVLLHALAGLLWTPLLLLYLWNHFRRTLGQRRAGVLFSGLAAALLLVVGVGSGVYLALVGLTETTGWVLATHITTVSACLVIGAAHLVWHIRGYDDKRRQRQESAWPSVADVVPGHVLAWLVGVPVVCLVLGFALQPGVGSGEPAVADYQYPYGEHPFRPSETETWDGGFVDLENIARSDDCAECHADIADQWQQSVHRHAADDPTYVTNISLLSDNKGIAATRYCEGCHAPAALLTGALSEGGLHGGMTESPAHHEGVGCLACHNIDRVEHTRGVASYRFGQASQYLFSRNSHPMLTPVRHWLTRMNPSLHKLEMARPVLSTPELCASCHAQFMEENLNHWGWVKMQDEYSAWRNSPYSGLNSEEFGQQPVRTCIDCHMGQEASSDPSSNAAGTVAGHFFPGANTVVPQHFGHAAQLARTKDFLRANQVAISIEEPNRIDAAQTLQALREDIRSQSETPFFYYLGETAELNVILTNRGIGHNFPGGTVDINEAWVSVTAVDGSGEMVFSSGGLTGDEYAPLAVEPGAEFYRSRPVDRRGELVWQHDLFNRVGEAEKRVIAAGKSDLLQYRFTIPDWAKSPLTVTATLNYRKLNDRYARWALGDEYKPVPVVDMARDSLIIPLYIRDPVTVKTPSATSD